jgi:1,4-dihydroxy-2-naphthoyl-CoA hydrolase
MADTAATEMIHGLVPLAVTLGITADAAGPDEVVLSLDWADKLTTGGGVLHGGIVMALADTSGAVCAFLNLPEGAGGTTTIESKTNFFRSTRSGTVKAHSRPLHVGRRVIVVETEIRGDGGKLAAKTIQSQAVL